MSPKHAARLAAEARCLRSQNKLDPLEYSVFDALLWTLRQKLSWDTAVDYNTICRESGVKRNKAVDAVKKLEALGLLRKVKQRMKVFWGRNHARTASRQTANLYVFHRIDTEFARPTTSLEIDILIDQVERVIDLNSPLERALRNLGAALGGSP